jgi:deoxyxylulose-5-phosphate synthase
MQKQNASYNNVNIAMKRQSEKQVEQIRRLEERVQNLTQQLVLLVHLLLSLMFDWYDISKGTCQQELATSLKAERSQKETCIENIQYLNETKEKLDSSDQRFTEVRCC